MSREANQISKVALIRSDVKHAEQIPEEEIRKMVHEAVVLTGGFSDIIKDGQIVVIKPNLISTRATPGPVSAITMLFSDPYKKDQAPMTVNGLTSDWRIAKVLVELVRDLNPSGKVYIMESSGDGRTRKNFKKMGYTHKNIPGVDQFVCMDESGDGYRIVESSDIVAINLKEKQKYKSLPSFLKNKYYFDKTFYAADVVISLCCLKNHFMTGITGGIKNIAIGAMPAKIYGNKKTKINRGITINHGWKSINNYIHDSYICKPVQFVITDGLQGLAYGPTGQGAPNYEMAKMNMRLILASRDPVAIDTVHACIVGVDPERVEYLRYLAGQGLGNTNTSKITVVGNARVDQVKKIFPMAKGIISWIWNIPPKTQYRNFEGPDFSINAATLKNNEFKANLDTDPSVTKVELIMEGQLLKSIEKDFKNIKYILDDPPLDIKLTFYAYDRFFNCKIKTVHFKQQLQRGNTYFSMYE